MTTIGVLALQGAFIEHIVALRRLGVTTREVRLPEQLDGLDGLIIPGGESTTIGKLMAAFNLLHKIKANADQGLPIFGTCAGLIVLAKATVQGYDQHLLKVMDIVVHRNGFGRQVDSFETDLVLPILGDKPFRGVFIRAPYVAQAGASVDVLGRLPDSKIICVQQHNLLATAFHPELTDDLRFHHYFLEIVKGQVRRPSLN